MRRKTGRRYHDFALDFARQLTPERIVRLAHGKRSMAFVLGETLMIEFSLSRDESTRES